MYQNIGITINENWRNNSSRENNINNINTIYNNIQEDNIKTNQLNADGSITKENNDKMAAEENESDNESDDGFSD